MILEEIKITIRSILTAFKTGCPIGTLCNEYKVTCGEVLPYHKFGLRSAAELLAKMPDVAYFSRNRRGEEVVFAVSTEATEHIASLVRRQKPAKIRNRGSGRNPRNKSSVTSRYRGGRQASSSSAPNANSRFNADAFDKRKMSSANFNQSNSSSAVNASSYANSSRPTTAQQSANYANSLSSSCANATSSFSSAAPHANYANSSVAATTTTAASYYATICSSSYNNNNKNNADAYGKPKAQFPPKFGPFSNFIGAALRDSGVETNRNGGVENSLLAPFPGFPVVSVSRNPFTATSSNAKSSNGGRQQIPSVTDASFAATVLQSCSVDGAEFADLDAKTFASKIAVLKRCPGFASAMLQRRGFDVWKTDRDTKDKSSRPFDMTSIGLNPSGFSTSESPVNQPKADFPSSGGGTSPVNQPKTGIYEEKRGDELSISQYLRNPPTPVQPISVVSTISVDLPPTDFFTLDSATVSSGRKLATAKRQNIESAINRNTSQFAAMNVTDETNERVAANGSGATVKKFAYNSIEPILEKSSIQSTGPPYRQPVFQSINVSLSSKPASSSVVTKPSEICDGAFADIPKEMIFTNVVRMSVDRLKCRLENM